MGRRTPAQLVEMLRREQVLDMPALSAAFPGRSQRGIIRDLVAVGYRTSCNLHGRFYALAETPDFDADGLWRHQHVLFSRHGTLRSTVRHLVEKADDGRLHRELQHQLQMRVHDTLRDLVQVGEIAREPIDQTFLYISPEPQAGAAQVARRRGGPAPAPTPLLNPSDVIAVLLAVIRRGDRRPEDVVTHLRAEGQHLGLDQVAEVFERYDLAKKNSRSAP